MEAVPGARFEARTYLSDAPPEAVRPADRAQLGIPSLDMVRVAAWRGGQPAHTDFSLVCPPTGRDAAKVMQLVREGVEAHGFDYAGGFTLFPRHAVALALVAFDRDDPDEAGRVAKLFPHLLAQAATIKAAPYRSHVAFMDQIAAQYDFGGQALLRLTERLKDVVDPAGILSPGKQGIWPGRSARPT